MANKFITVLEDAGRDIEKGLEKILPFAKVIGEVIGAGNPALGAAIETAVNVAAATEQKFVAIGKQSGTGLQKLAEVAGIVGPVVSQALAAEGQPADAAAVTKYVKMGVGIANALPAGTTL